MIVDFLRTCLYCLFLLVAEPRALTIALIVAVVIAIGSWSLCWTSVHAWNKHFHMRPSHHFACLVAGLLSFFATVLFAAFNYTDQAASRSLKTWVKEFQLRETTPDKHGESALGRKIFYAVDKVDPQKYDDGTPYNPESWNPDNGRSRTSQSGPVSQYSVLLSRQESIEAEVVAIADTMFADLGNHREFLSWLTIGARGQSDKKIEIAVVPWSVDEVFAKRHRVSYASIIDRCLGIMELEVQDRLRRSRTLSRATLIAIVLFLQAAAFGIVGYAAYQDLKVHAGRR